MSPYLAETRYPLELAPAMPDVWELWQRAKTLEWDPETDIPWEELHPERYPADQIMAARLHWSRRTWGEYGAISESPALLLRFCLENRLPDLRFFFTMRTQEEGRHAEASWLMAERLGGYFPQPQNPPTVSAVGTHGVRRMAFDPDTSLEGIFASLVCAAEEILIDAFKATVHKASNVAVRRLMELILRDEVRHIAFGWQCLDAWAPSFTPETVKNIERAVTQMIQNVEFNGYRNLWLAIEGGSATSLEIDPRGRDAHRAPVHQEDPGPDGAVGRGAAAVRPPEAREGVARSACGPLPSSTSRRGAWRRPRTSSRGTARTPSSSPAARAWCR